jgi:hypothetical protein
MNITAIDCVRTEERQDLDDRQKRCSESCLVQELWDKKKHKDSAVDESDGSENHVGGEERNTKQCYTVRMESKQNEVSKITTVPVDECRRCLKEWETQLRTAEFYNIQSCHSEGKCSVGKFFILLLLLVLHCRNPIGKPSRSPTIVPRPLHFRQVINIHVLRVVGHGSISDRSPQAEKSSLME